MGREAVGKRGRNHFVIGAAETMVCYQGSWVSQAEQIWQLQSDSPKVGGLQTQFSPCLAKAGQPSVQASSRRPREQQEPREKGQLSVRVSQFVKYLLQNHFGQQGCRMLVKCINDWNPIQIIRISWGPALGYLASALDEFQPQLGLIIIC